MLLNIQTKNEHLASVLTFINAENKVLFHPKVFVTLISSSELILRLMKFITILQNIIFLIIIEFNKLIHEVKIMFSTVSLKLEYCLTNQKN